MKLKSFKELMGTDELNEEDTQEYLKNQSERI